MPRVVDRNTQRNIVLVEPFNGELDFSDGDMWYSDYVSGGTVNITALPDKRDGTRCYVRIQGDLTGAIPSNWAFTGTALSSSATEFNFLTFEYISPLDVRVYNAVVSKPTPIRVLCIGDSISAGHSPNPRDASPGCLYEWNGSSVIKVSDDVANANIGSPYPAMGNRLAEVTQRPFHYVGFGVGGSEFSPNGDTDNWSSTGTLYSPMVTSAGNYLTDQSVSSFDLIRITCGINDARGSATLTNIESDMYDLIDRLIVDFPSTDILLNQLGRPTTDVARTNVVKGYVDDIVSTYSEVYAGTDFSLYPESWYNGLHLTDYGNDQLGKDDADLISSLI